ncbi:ATP-binding protein [Patescibacteria group bacterium]|nr:MAG: ATP-binding protein [Patescibacteria group bacterium]
MKPLSLTNPHLIIMVGIPGSGKSFFAEHFANTFNAPFISHDKIAKDIAGDSQVDSTTVVRISNFLLAELLKSGQTIIYEGLTDTRTARQVLAKIARDMGYEPLLVWVQTESLAAKQRATKPQRDKSNLTDEQFDTMLHRFTPPSIIEKPIVISGKHTYPSQLKIVLKHLAVNRSETIPERKVIEGRHIAVR